MVNWSRVVERQDARHRLAVSTLVTLAGWLLIRHRGGPAIQIVASWDLFALISLALAWVTIVLTPVEQMRSKAQTQDVSHLLIFIFVVAVASASLFAVIVLFSGTKTHEAHHVRAYVVLSAVAVLSAWALLHTVFGLRYAHLYYGDNDEDGQDPARGLLFPDEEAPDYQDFAYFAFVIGMTFQVSDVQITSREMRRLVLLHSLLSFGFNTVIIALSVNTVASLL
jgi:uncharacterized membrane protein